MTEQKKLSRRDAIKLIGATAGASALAKLPSKWSKPTLAGGMIPAHAQTSGCGPLTQSMLVEFLEVNGNNIPANYGMLPSAYNDLIQTTGDLGGTGSTIFFPCLDGCAGVGIGVDASTTATVRVTINGVVVAYWVDITDVYHFVEYDGSTGQSSVDEPVGCWGGRNKAAEKYRVYNQ